MEKEQVKPNMASTPDEMEELVKKALGRLTVLRVEYFMTHSLGDVFEEEGIFE